MTFIDYNTREQTIVKQLYSEQLEHSIQLSRGSIERCSFDEDGVVQREEHFHFTTIIGKEGECEQGLEPAHATHGAASPVCSATCGGTTTKRLAHVPSTRHRRSPSLSKATYGTERGQQPEVRV